MPVVITGRSGPDTNSYLVKVIIQCKSEINLVFFVQILRR